MSASFKPRRHRLRKLAIGLGAYVGGANLVGATGTGRRLVANSIKFARRSGMHGFHPLAKSFLSSQRSRRAAGRTIMSNAGRLAPLFRRAKGLLRAI